MEETTVAGTVGIAYDPAVESTSTSLAWCINMMALDFTLGH